MENRTKWIIGPATKHIDNFRDIIKTQENWTKVCAKIIDMGPFDCEGEFGLNMLGLVMTVHVHGPRIVTIEFLTKAD